MRTETYRNLGYLLTTIAKQRGLTVDMIDFDGAGGYTWVTIPASDPPTEAELEALQNSLQSAEDMRKTQQAEDEAALKGIAAVIANERQQIETAKTALGEIKSFEDLRPLLDDILTRVDTLNTRVEQIVRLLGKD